MPSEISQTEENKSCRVSLIYGISKKKKKENEVRLSVVTEESQGVRGGGTRRRWARGTRFPLHE